jgi:chaperonin GroES
MTKLNIKPTPGFLLIEPVEAERKTASGLVLPESHEEKPQRGKVLAVGASEECKCEDKCQKPSPCKTGDIVYYKQWGGNEVKIEGKEYLFVKFEDILAVEISK